MDTSAPLSEDAKLVAEVAGKPEAIDVLRELYIKNRKLDQDTVAQVRRDALFWDIPYSVSTVGRDWCSEKRG